MSIKSMSNSRAASCGICLDAMSEPGARQDGAGIYLGKTKIYRLPFYLDAGRLVNPHVVVLGMSGSGKTYFLKGLIARHSVYNSGSVMIVDWNGEYRDVVEFLGGVSLEVRAGSSLDAACAGAAGQGAAVVRFDLSSLKDEKDREEVSKAVLKEILEQMHGTRMGSGPHRVVVLDEGWRLLGSSGEVAALFREGRKYGYGFVVATQLAKDINNEAIANAACLALFRLQSRDDYELLAGAGIINGAERDELSKLGVGSCMIRLAEKDSAGKVKTFLMQRIDGVSVDVYSLVGDCVNMRISGRKFMEETERLAASDEARSRIIEFANDNDRSIDLAALAGLMAKMGVERGEVIRYFRALGVRDVDTMRAYGRATGAATLLVQE